MKRKNYESLVIINAAIEEEQIEAAINRISETITINGGEILELEKWGRKRLAYSIDKAKSGYYALFRFNASVDLISKLERVYQLDEYIIRYLTIALDKFAMEYIEKGKSSKLAEPVSETAEQGSSAGPAETEDLEAKK